jgi:hypothetical protein
MKEFIKMMIDQRKHNVKSFDAKTQVAIIKFAMELAILVEENKFSKVFLKSLVGSYTDSQLKTIILLMRHELHAREKKVLNNEV